MLLYNSAVSGNCYKVRLLLAQLGVEYETVEVSVVDRSNRAELLGELNPGLRVPTLVLDDGRPLGESNAILWYFGEGTSFVPDDRYERAQMLQWMFFEQYSHEPYIAVVRFWLRVLRDAGEVRRPGSRAAEGRATPRSTRWSGTSRERSFLVGERYSIADIALYAYTHVAHEGDFDLEPYPAIRDVARARRVAAGARPDRRVTTPAVRVRFAPSPTGSLHVGNALTAVANRASPTSAAARSSCASTTPIRRARSRAARRRSSTTSTWLGIAFDEGPVRQSERGPLYAEAAERALAVGRRRAGRRRRRPPRPDGTTLLRADGTATYQLASVVDDLELGITHVIRGSDHRPNLELQQRIARAVGGELPEVIHHGLVLGPDGKKLSKRHGHVVHRRPARRGLSGRGGAGVPRRARPARARRAARPRARLRRLAIDAIAAMTDDELAAAVGAPLEVAPVLRARGRSSRRATYAQLVLDPAPVELPRRGARRRSSASASCAPAPSGSITPRRARSSAS